MLYVAPASLSRPFLAHLFIHLSFRHTGCLTAPWPWPTFSCFCLYLCYFFSQCLSPHHPPDECLPSFRAAIDWMFMSCCTPSPNTPKFIYWNLMPNMLVLGGGAFGRWLNHDSGMYMNGISILKWRDMREFASFILYSLPCEDTVERQPPTSREVGSHQTLDLLAP